MSTTNEQTKTPDRDVFMRKGITLDMANVKVIDDDAGAGRLQGYASVFGNVDLQGDVIKKGAFKKTIRERVKSRKSRLMAQHFPYAASVLDVIGTIETAKEDDTGLFIDAAFAETDVAQQVRTLVKGGHVDGLSIGGYPMAATWVSRDDGSEGWDIKEFALWETTVTAFPANQEAVGATAKSLADVAKSVEDLEQMDTAQAQEEACRLLSEIGGLEALKGAAQILERFTVPAVPAEVTQKRADIARLKAKIRAAQLEAMKGQNQWTS